jgi:hypothetical protein
MLDLGNFACLVCVLECIQKKEREDKEREENEVDRERSIEIKWVGHQLLPAYLSVRAPAVTMYYRRTKSMVRRLYWRIWRA